MTLHFHTETGVTSWSRVGARDHFVATPRFVEDISAWSEKSYDQRLAIGAGRSYSDVGLAAGGNLIRMTGLDRIRHFDADTGVLRAEAGVTLDAILNFAVPAGYFLPVTPGTRFVTLGGAVANDVHGKNHHRAGTFGRHVRALLLERSGDGRLRASPTEHQQLFAATIGGLGLTGIILEVELQLQPIASSMLDVETVACDGLDALCDTLEACEQDYEHSVAWIDCTARAQLGRGIVSRANWTDTGPRHPHSPRTKSIPAPDLLPSVLNPVTLRAFNQAYYALGKMRAGHHRVSYDQFFYPLDAITNWNHLYGRSGFYQYQCLIPASAGREPLRELLTQIAASGEGSLLAVLKTFGDIESPGMLSFPRKGLTLALDFRNCGDRTLALFNRFDGLVNECGGRLYPAKDWRMPRALFRAGHPSLDTFAAWVDPCCQSAFWKRVSQ